MASYEFPFFGKIDINGKLSINDKSNFVKYLKQFKPINKDFTEVEILIRKRKSKRSLEQNRLWWLYITILANETGMLKDAMHEICKYKFLKKETVIESTGEIMEYIGSTTQLNKSEFADMIAELQQWASESLNIILPSPGEQIEILTK